MTNIETCIDSRIKIYPYKDLEYSGLTDKFSCYSYNPITLSASLDSSEVIRFEAPLKIGSVIKDPSVGAYSPKYREYALIIFIFIIK